MRILSHFNVKYGHQRKLKLHLSSLLSVELIIAKTPKNVVTSEVDQLLIIVFITDINECSSNPCLNGGFCVDYVNRYACLCQPGYTGTRCQSGTWVLAFKTLQMLVRETILVEEAILHSRRLLSYENDGDNSLIVLSHCGSSNFGPSLPGNYYIAPYTRKNGWGLFRKHIETI